MIWFTSDEHIGHEHILRYMDRPCEGMCEMEDMLVARHNEVVAKGDIVYHLGDVSFKPEHVERYIKRLKGQHFLIRGNHDPKKQPPVWAWEGLAKSVKHNGDIFWLSHYPHITWPQSNYGSFQLFGHSHGMLPDTGKRQMDVGVDTNNLYPYSAEEVITRLSDRGISEHHPRGE